MSKATQRGQADANTWMAENPHGAWARAIRPGTLGADEALINAMGVEEAAVFLGVPRPHVDGELTKSAYKAFRDYARAWTATIEQALKSGPKSSHATRGPVADVTNAQIRALRREAGSAGDLAQVLLCDLALGVVVLDEDTPLKSLRAMSFLSPRDKRRISEMAPEEYRAECARAIESGQG